MLTEENAATFASHHALVHAGEQSYLPTTAEEAADFVPHPWVVDAIQQAHQLGSDSTVDFENAATRIMSNLNGRSGVLDGIDGDIIQEIKDELVEIIKSEIK